MNLFEYRKGDVVEAYTKGEIDILIHSCNCFNTMGSGVAKAIRAKYPQVYDADCKTKKGDVLKLGNFSRWVEVDSYEKFKVIYNLYGQYNYGYDGNKYVEYAAINSGLYRIFCDIYEEQCGFAYREGCTIGLPKIGCGLAGGDWELVSQILNKRLADDLPNLKGVFVYELD